MSTAFILISPSRRLVESIFFLIHHLKHNRIVIRTHLMYGKCFFLKLSLAWMENWVWTLCEPSSYRKFPLWKNEQDVSLDADSGGSNLFIRRLRTKWPFFICFSLGIRSLLPECWIENPQIWASTMRCIKRWNDEKFNLGGNPRIEHPHVKSNANINIYLIDFTCCMMLWNTLKYVFDNR